jgi:Domain of unknown function (DUF1835)
VSRHDVVHVAPGLSASGTIKQALRLRAPSCLVAFDDWLSCGPLRPFQSVAEWRELRERYWTDIDTGEGLWTSSYERAPVDLLDKAGVFNNCDSIALWIGTGLAEQLLQVWLVQLLRLLGIDLARLRVIQFHRVGQARPEVLGIGELNLDYLRAHPPEQALDPDSVAELNSAWAAVTSTDPAALLSFLARGAGHLPFLSRSLRLLLARYPDYQTGLSIWDRLLLQYTLDQGPRAVRIVGSAMTHDFHYPDGVGDVYLFARLQRLADPRLPRPLVVLEGSGTAMRNTEARLTDGGRAVLRGEANAVQLNGIDDWVAGVHLDSRTGRVWFNQEGTLVEREIPTG